MCDHVQRQTLAFCALQLHFMQFVISCYVAPWDNPTPPAGIDATFPHCDNIEMGNGLLGVVIHPNTKGESMIVMPDNLKQLTENGTLQ